MTDSKKKRGLRPPDIGRYDDDDDDDDDDDEDGFLEEYELPVEIMVRVGDVNSVSLTTDAIIDTRDSQAAIEKLRGVTTMLRRSIPVAELAGQEREYRESMDAEIFAIGKDGAVIRTLPKPGRQRRRRNKRKHDGERENK